jgi:hypothetical protein
MSQVYSGKDGYLLINGVEQLKVTKWMLNGSLEMLETTTLEQYQKTFVPGVQEFSGTASLLYYTDESGRNDAATALRKVLRVDGVKDGDIVVLTLRLSGTDSLAHDISIAAYVTGVTFNASVGEVSAADIVFQGSGALYEAALLSTFAGESTPTIVPQNNNFIDTLKLAVSKLQQGSPRQVLQTNNTGTSAEWSSNLSLNNLQADGSVTLSASTTIGGNAPITSVSVINGSSVAVSPFRKLSDYSGDVVNVKDYGAVGNGIVDDTSAIQAALNRVNTLGGGVVYFTPGRYRKADTSPTLLMYSNTTLRGDGDCSVIVHDDLPTNPRKDLLVADNTQNIAFVNFKIEGTVYAHTVETNQSQTLTGFNVVNLRMLGVTIQGVRFMATAFTYARDVIVQECRFVDVLRDGARFTASSNVSIVGNVFYRVADDAIALHSIDPDTNFPVPAGFTSWDNVPPSSGITISGNTFEACQGIKILGAKTALITNNVMRRMLRLPIVIDNTINLPEGNTPIFCVQIVNNIITDTFYNFNAPTDTGGYAIKIKIRDRSAGALSSQPGYSSDVSPYNWVNNIDAAGKVNVGSWGITVAQNTIATTLPVTGVSTYSDYGYGNLLDRQGGSLGPGFYNPSITSTFFAVDGIYFEGPVRGLVIESNMLSGGGINTSAIVIKGYASSNGLDRASAVVRNNTVTDWPGTGIELNSANSASHYVVLGNWLDLDPLFRHPSHASTNKWTSSSVVYGINVVSGICGVAAYNTVQHMSDIVTDAGAFSWHNNYAIYDPNGTDGLGDEPDCRGIRKILRQVAFNAIIYDGNPSSAAFKEIITVPDIAAISIPTSGTYVKGHVVKNVAGTVVNPGAGQEYYVIGWQRITTGSGHVLNTDWKELRCLTGA